MKKLLVFILLSTALPFLLYAADVLPQFSEAYLTAAEKKFGARVRQRLQEWERVITQNRNKSESEKLKIVNDFFNKIPYVSDTLNYGREDYWATPAEMLTKNGGDCNDYAIGKYLTLVALDVHPSKLKITYVKARINNNSIAHMVLTYYSQPNAVPLVLDNLIREMKPASQRSDLTPVYSFNADGLWVVKSRAMQTNRVGNSSNIRRWREMQSRLGKEFQ